MAIESHRHSHESKNWTRGIIKEISNDMLVVFVAEENNLLYIRKNSFEYAKANTMTRDYDWRINLKEGDIIDCYDRGRWFPSTILEKKTIIINELPRIDYRIGFRIYPHLFADWKEYRYVWPEKSINLQSDSKNQEYYGDSENLDENILFSSKRIQKFNTHLSIINSYNDLSRGEECENYFIDDFIKVFFT